MLYKCTYTLNILNIYIEHSWSEYMNKYTIAIGGGVWVIGMLENIVGYVKKGVGKERQTNY